MIVQESMFAVTEKESDVNFNWQNFLLLSFTVSNYGNYSPSCVVAKNVFSKMGPGIRALLTYENAIFQVYPNGNGQVHIKVTNDIPTASQLKITGIISKT